MDALLLFLHLGGLSVWLGSAVMVALQLMIMKRNIQATDISSLTSKTIRVFTRVTHPSAFLVLLSGIWMLMRIGMENHDNFPFWLKFMEMFGSMVILIFIITVSILGKKVIKRIAEGNWSLVGKSIITFIIVTLIFAVLAFVIIFVVSGKY
ncbi:hypothetical protein [Cohnella sp. WQ 127256]|uniref:hypothetical protein n=1 Tax=Cohnella sp. WQ 127256 TaxID=2938790 RepID=UPI002118FB5F|nr:hypothetical protein [Cohnella sp. WQ 127256]